MLKTAQHSAAVEAVIAAAAASAASAAEAPSSDVVALVPPTWPCLPLYSDRNLEHNLERNPHHHVHLPDKVAMGDKPGDKRKKDSPASSKAPPTTKSTDNKSKRRRAEAGAQASGLGGGAADAAQAAATASVAAVLSGVDTDDGIAAMTAAAPAEDDNVWSVLGLAAALPYRQRPYIADGSRNAGAHKFHRLRAEYYLAKYVEKDEQKAERLHKEYEEETHYKFETGVSTRESDMSLQYGTSSGWSDAKAVREFVQNLIDEVHAANGDSFEHISVEVVEKKNVRTEIIMNGREILAEITTRRMVSKHEHVDVLELVNYGVGPGRKIFKIGYSSKTSNKLVLGVHGEGIKMGTYQLLRAGFDVEFESSFSQVGRESLDRRQPERTCYTVLNNDVTYRHTMFVPRQRNLVALKQKGHLDLDRFVVRIKAPVASVDAPSPIPRATIQDYVLPLDEIAVGRALALGDSGRVLFDDDFDGKLYVVHMFLFKGSRLFFGYDFAKVPLGRDRDFIHDRRLARYVAAAFDAAVQRDDEYGATARDELCGMFFDNLAEASDCMTINPAVYRTIEYQAFVRHMRPATIAAVMRHVPADTVICSWVVQNAAVINAEQLGKRVVRVEQGLYDVLAPHVMTVERLYAETETALFDSRGDSDAAESVEHAMMLRAQAMVQKACRMCYKSEALSVKIVSKSSIPLNVVYRAADQVCMLNTYHVLQQARQNLGGNGGGGGQEAVAEEVAMSAIFLLLMEVVDRCATPADGKMLMVRVLVLLRRSVEGRHGENGGGAAGDDDRNEHHGDEHDDENHGDEHHEDQPGAAIRGEAAHLIVGAGREMNNDEMVSPHQIITVCVDPASTGDLSVYAMHRAQHMLLCHTSL